VLNDLAHSGVFERRGPLEVVLRNDSAIGCREVRGADHGIADVAAAHLEAAR
jgi:hypothetical protein